MTCVGIFPAGGNGGALINQESSVGPSKGLGTLPMGWLMRLSMSSERALLFQVLLSSRAFFF